MKSFFTITLSCIFLILGSCKKHVDKVNVVPIENTKWKFTYAIDHNSGDSIIIPPQLDKYYILFKTKDVIEVEGFCNYTNGVYSLSNTNILEVSNLGPGTFLYCPPANQMDWEKIMVKNLRLSQKCSIQENRLTIESQDDYNLVFDFVANL